MLAFGPASMVNQKPPDLGIPNRFNQLHPALAATSRSRAWETMGGDAGSERFDVGFRMWRLVHIARRLFKHCSGMNLYRADGRHFGIFSWLEVCLFSFLAWGFARAKRAGNNLCPSPRTGVASARAASLLVLVSDLLHETFAARRAKYADPSALLSAANPGGR